MSMTVELQDLQVFEAWFETDEGMQSASFDAGNLQVATAMLKKAFPDDVGADGFWSLPDGAEHPISW